MSTLYQLGSILVSHALLLIVISAVANANDNGDDSLYNRASDLRLVVLLITFLMFYCVLY